MIEWMCAYIEDQILKELPITLSSEKRPSRENVLIISLDTISVNITVVMYQNLLFFICKGIIDIDEFIYS